jgi:iron-only hydrogenase group A
MRSLVPSCAFPVSDGMKVSTHSERVRRARKTIVELLLANHPGDCLVCVRCGDCELQNLAREFGVREYRYLGEKRKYKIDTSSASIERDPNKCILCGRCVKICEEIQATGAIDFTLRGFNTIVLPAFNRQLADAACVNCGQCIVGCPTAALREKSALREVWAAINDPKKHVIFQIAPAIRVALGEEFGLPAGTDVTGKIPSALRRIGADKVFDTNFTADLTIMEEASELVQRLTKGGPIPLITSCSPGWVKYMEHFFSELIPNVSTCKSPHMMLGALAKTYYAEKEGLDPEHVFVVSVMPCTAKKYEITRPEMEHDGLRDVDAVLTTRELGRMLTVAGIHFDDLQDEEFDHPMGESTGAADIFGTTGGVAEAALRTGYYFVTGQELGSVDFQEIRGAQGIKETTVKVGDIELRVAVASGLRNARKLCKEAAAGNSPYHLIEIMGCPGGCVNGGGQPIAKNADAVKARRKTLYDIDANKPKRQSHQNTEIQQIYHDFLGEPLGQKSHHLLHTTYRARERG